MSRCMLLFVVSVALLGGEAHAQNDWPMLNGNRERNSCAAGENILRPPLRVLRDVQAEGGQLSYAKGLLLATTLSSDSNRVYAVDAATGTLRWRFAVPGALAGMNHTPAIADSIVLVGGQQGYGLFALEKTSGAVRWSKKIGGLYDRSAVLDAGYAYIIGDSTYCLRVSDGSVIWSKPLNTQGSPMVDELYAYVWSADNTLVAFEKRGGAQRWKVACPGYNALAADAQYVYTEDGYSIVARSKSDGTIRQRYSLPPGAFTSASNALAVSDTHLAAVMWPDSATKRARLHVLSKSTGNGWSHDFPASGVFPVTIANGVIYAVTWRPGHLHGLDAATGAVYFVDSTAEYTEQPIVADHMLFAPTRNGVRIFGAMPGSAARPESVYDDPPARIEGIWPQPVRGDGTVAIRVNRPSKVMIDVIDALGRIVHTIADEDLEPGYYTRSPGLQRCPPGVYVVFLRASGFRHMMRILNVGR